MPKATRKSLSSVASPARSSPRASTKASTAAAGTTSPAKSPGKRGKAQAETETRGRSGSRNAGKVQTPSPATGHGGSRTRGKSNTPTAAVTKTPPTAGRARRGKPEKEETEELEEKGQASTSTSGRRGRGSMKKDEEPSKEAEAKKTLTAASRRSRSKAGREEEAEDDGKKSEEAGKAEVKSSPAEGRRNRGRAVKEVEPQVEEKEKGQAIIEEAKKTPPTPARRGRGSPAIKGEDHKELPEQTSEKDTKKTPTVSGKRGRNQGRSKAEQQKEETAQEEMEKEVNKTSASAKRGRGRLGKEEEEAECKSDKDQAEEMTPSPSKRGRGKNKTVEEAEGKEKDIKSPTSSRHGGKGKEKQEEPEEKKIEEAAEAEDKMEVVEERKDDKEKITPKKGRGRGGQITAEAAETKSTPPKAAHSLRHSAGPLCAEGGQTEESSSPPVRCLKGKSDQAKPAVVDSESAGSSDGVANAEDDKEAEAEKVTETVGNQENLRLTKETDSKTEEKEEDMAEKEAGPAEVEETKPPTGRNEMETEAQETAIDVNATKTEESSGDKIEATKTVQSLENLSREPAQEEIAPMEQELLSEAEPRNGETEVSGDKNKNSGKRKLEEGTIQDESSAAAKKARLNGTEPFSVDMAEPDPASAEEDMNDAEVLKSFVVVSKEELPAPDSEEVAAAVPQVAEETHSSSSEESMETDKIVLPCFVEPAVVPLTEAEVAKAYANEIQGSKKEESDDISSVIVEVGSVAGSDIVSNLAARGLDTSELQSASNSIDGEEVADASINESAFAGTDSEFISSEMQQEIAAIDTDEVLVSEKASSTPVQSGSKVLVSKGSSSVSLSLGTPDPTFLATYSSPDIFTRAYVPNPAVSPESGVVTNNFSVVSYNILAECHRLNSDYSYTPVEYLGLEYRHALLMRELEYLNGDIVCLQEVSPAYFSSTLQPKMKSLGYEGLMKCRTKDVDEGEATFYKRDHFVLEASKEVSLGEAAQKEVEAGGLTPEVCEAVKTYLDRADVVLITKLRCKNSGKVITVGNVHIVWDNLQSPDAQCIQAACAIKEIVTVAGGDGAHIICGDFNSEWSSPIYQLVVDGYLSDSSIHILQAVQRLELEAGAMGTSPKKKMSKSERNRLYRLKILTNPEKASEFLQKERERAKLNRQKQKTPEELQKDKEQKAARNRRHYQKKKQEKLLSPSPVPGPITRLESANIEHRRELNRLRVAKHRDNMHPQKRRRVNEKARQYREMKKQEKLQAKLIETSKSVQCQPQYMECPYPTVESFKRAVRRVKVKLNARGVKLAYLCKGLLKSADKEAKKKLNDLHVSFTTPDKAVSVTEILAGHIEAIKCQRDKTTLEHKRQLAEVFNASSEAAASIRLSKRLIRASKLTVSRDMYSIRNQNAVKNSVQRFYCENSHADPCKKSKSRQLLLPVIELHKQYSAQNPELPVSLRSFYRMKPPRIASVKKAKFRQCLCEVCLNPKLKLERLNQLLVHKSTCVRELLEESVCAFLNLPALKCVMRECEQCGVDKVKSRFESELESQLDACIGWSRWEHVKEGKTSRMDRVRKKGTVQECVDELINELFALYRHLFVAEWQRKQLQQLKSKLPAGWALVFVDFSENFLCRFQNEPQSAHWAYKQLSLFPAVVFRNCPSQGCTELRREEVCFVSDELVKDAHLSQVCLDRIVHKLEEVQGLQKVIFASDGCAAQFKSKLPFFLLTTMKASIPVEKVFLGARHGKNDSDWSGGAIKRAVTRAVAAGTVDIRTAAEMVDHCQQHLSFGDGVKEGCCHKTRQFELIMSIDRNIQSKELGTVVGSRSLHHVRAMGPGMLATRHLACFCSQCCRGDFSACTSPDYVDRWKVVKMKQSFVPVQEEEDEEIDKEDTLPDSGSEISVSEDFAEAFAVDSDICEHPSKCGLDDSVACELNEGFISEDADSLSFRQSPLDTRLSFFQSKSAELLACESFQQVQDVCRKIKSAIAGFVFPKEVSFSGLTGDSFSQSLLPQELTANGIVLNVEGDGACFFRSLSVLLFGSEIHHLELRVRTVVSMATESNIFLDGDAWACEADGLDGIHVIEVARLTAVQPHCAPKDAFQQEVLAVRDPKAYSGLWVLMGACHALGRPIQSVFPPLGWPLYQKHCNRIFRPPGCQVQKKLIVMWTSTRHDMPAQHWTPNHFSPIILQPHPLDIPVLQSFRMISWDSKDFVGQIHETDELLGLVLVKFMACKSRFLWYWPLKDEYSWEPFSAVKKEVTLVLDEAVSTHRCLYFRSV